MYSFNFTIAKKNKKGRERESSVRDSELNPQKEITKII